MTQIPDSDANIDFMYQDTTFSLSANKCRY